MSRKLIAIFVSIALAFGSISTNGWSAPAETQPIAASEMQGGVWETKNIPPLLPAGAAGVREAQGMGGNEAWILAGFIAAFLLFVLLDSGGDDDEDEIPAGTGT
jgi:hypothetical protein